MPLWRILFNPIGPHFFGWIITCIVTTKGSLKRIPIRGCLEICVVVRSCLMVFHFLGTFDRVMFTFLYVKQFLSHNHLCHCVTVKGDINSSFGIYALEAYPYQQPLPRAKSKRHSEKSSAYCQQSFDNYIMVFNCVFIFRRCLYRFPLR